MSDFFKPQTVDLENLMHSRENENKFKLSPEAKDSARQEFLRAMNEITLEAVYKHTEGVSYRGLRVGGGGLGIDKQGNLLKDYEHNFKPRRLRQYGWDKLCAENNVCTAILLNGGEYIAGLVVVSNHKVVGHDSEDLNHSQHALHSCLNCRNLFRELIKNGIMDFQTIVRFVNDESLVYEDNQDTETVIAGEDHEPKLAQVPKLKLKRKIGQADVENLPFEQMTMGKFLSLPEYQKDKVAKKGKAVPPYEL